VPIPCAHVGCKVCSKIIAKVGGAYSGLQLVLRFATQAGPSLCEALHPTRTTTPTRPDRSNVRTASRGCIWRIRCTLRSLGRYESAARLAQELDPMLSVRLVTVQKLSDARSPPIRSARNRCPRPPESVPKSHRNRRPSAGRISTKPVAARFRPFDPDLLAISTPTPMGRVDTHAGAVAAERPAVCCTPLRPCTRRAGSLRSL
jgi:hypothetical protein